MRDSKNRKAENGQPKDGTCFDLLDQGRSRPRRKGQGSRQRAGTQFCDLACPEGFGMAPETLQEMKNGVDRRINPSPINA